MTLEIPKEKVDKVVGGIRPPKQVEAPSGDLYQFGAHRDLGSCLLPAVATEKPRGHKVPSEFPGSSPSWKQTLETMVLSEGKIVELSTTELSDGSLTKDQEKRFEALREDVAKQAGLTCPRANSLGDYLVCALTDIADHQVTQRARRQSGSDQDIVTPDAYYRSVGETREFQLRLYLLEAILKKQLDENITLDRREHITTWLKAINQVNEQAGQGLVKPYLSTFETLHSLTEEAERLRMYRTLNQSVLGQHGKLKRAQVKHTGNEGFFTYLDTLFYAETSAETVLTGGRRQVMGLSNALDYTAEALGGILTVSDEVKSERRIIKVTLGGRGVSGLPPIDIGALVINKNTFIPLVSSDSKVKIVKGEGTVIFGDDGRLICGKYGLPMIISDNRFLYYTGTSWEPAYPIKI